MREGAEVMHQAWLPVEGDVGPVSRVFQAREQMSNGVVLGTVSGSVFLGDKGMKRPGERLTGEMGKKRKVLGAMGRSLDFILVVSGSQPCLHISFLGNLKKKYGCLIPSCQSNQNL